MLEELAVRDLKQETIPEHVAQGQEPQGASASFDGAGSFKCSDILCAPKMCPKLLFKIQITSCIPT